MAENKNMKVDDDVMMNATGGEGDREEVVLFKVGERVVYKSTGGVGRIREVYPNEKDPMDSRYTVVFEFEVLRNVKHRLLRKVHPV